MRCRTVIFEREERIEVDVEATCRLYAALDRPLSETCTCVECRGFVAHRRLALPPSFCELLAGMGIDWTNEGELWAVAGPWDFYVSATFDFVGEAAPSLRRLAPGLDSQFEYAFSNVSSVRCSKVATAMRLGPVASVRFGTVLPVRLHAPERLPDLLESLSR
jgi:hypothetical protein